MELQQPVVVIEMAVDGCWRVRVDGLAGDEDGVETVEFAVLVKDQGQSVPALVRQATSRAILLLQQALVAGKKGH
ncbi:hypothetical protein [Roseateles sp.]|uniref:hypothetical protein n=1 Tax=Roseateles sp. TaxID=1971397 RepID=UPI003BAD4269